MSGIPLRSPRTMCAAVFAVTALVSVQGVFALESSAENFGELLKVQAQVQSRLEAVSRALVAVESGDGAASGVIVSPDGLVLTAAHVTTTPGRVISSLILADGRKVACKALGLDKWTDAAMMKIAGDKKDWPFVPLCRDLRMAKPGTWCFALGHPGGRDVKRGPVLRVGKVLKQTPNGLQTDCILMGGDSGGPLFNLDGDVIGVHSQIWEQRDQNVHVSVAPFLRAWDELKNSRVVAAWSTGAGGWLGVHTQISASAELEVAEVAKDSPAAIAGLTAGDVILALDGETMGDQPQFSSAISSRPSGTTISLQVRTKSSTRMVDVRLGNKPTEAN